jgi:hypothetical protein
MKGLLHGLRVLKRLATIERRLAELEKPHNHAIEQLCSWTSSYAPHTPPQQKDH